MKSTIVKARKLTTPSALEKRKKARIADIVLKKVVQEIREYQGVVGAELGGSYSKDTWLSQTDIDVFVKFEKSIADEKFRKDGESIGFGALKGFAPYVRYSSHPFVEATIQGSKVNVVPCFDVQQGIWQSAADRSLFHTKFMLENLTPSMRADVRVLKQFLRCANLYGAEISNQGFSGYATEVLIHSYGGFEKVVRNMTNIRNGEIIGSTSKKFDTAITIIDPIDSARNLAAAISTENVGKFVLLCRAFAKNPALSFFKPKRQKYNSDILGNCVLVKFTHMQKSPDNLWGQIKRAASVASTALENNGFRVVRHGAVTDYDEKRGVCLFFVLESVKISANRTRKGPSFFSKNDVEQFVTKNAKGSISMWVDNDGHLRILERRLETDAIVLLGRLFDSELEDFGVPKGIREDIKNGFKVSSGNAKLGTALKGAILDAVSTDTSVFSSS